MPRRDDTRIEKVVTPSRQVGSPDVSRATGQIGCHAPPTPVRNTQ